MARKTNQKRKRRASTSKRDERVAAELQEVNDILQDDERSQKETWQIGKRLKKLMEDHPTMNKRQTIDAFFLWGTALARLASQNEDATLAEAAADKFQEMHELSGGDDAAMGAVGYSLWASSLLIMALELQSREVLDKALEKFQQAVDVDGGTTFETRFQYARALKEGGDMVKFLEEEAAAVAAATSDELTSVTKTAEKKEYRQYYERALTLCEELEKVYEEEVGRAHAAKERDQADGGDDDEEEQEDEGDEEEEDEEGEDDDDAFDDDDVDPEDDIVNVTDLAEVKLLQAILHGMLEDDASDEQARANVDRTIALFKRAMELDVENPGVLMELANYVALKCTTRRQNRTLDSVAWDEIMDFLDDQYRVALARVEFDMAECKQICFRKDTEQEEEPEDEESTDAQVPHLLHALGKALVSYLIGEACASGAAQSAKLPKKATLAELKKMGKIQGSSGGGVRGSGGGKGFLSKMKGKGKLSMLNSKTGKKHPRFLHTIEVLRSAHHFHDKLGCYPLACLFAHSAYQDEAQCKVWLETAETYGVLDDELQLHDFEAFWEAPWFAKFTQPVEQIEVDDEAQEDDAAKEADSAVAH